MDILELKPSERIIEITHPKTGENIGVRVSLVSVDDEKLKNIKRNIKDKQLRLEARGKHFNAEQIEDNTFDMMFVAMTGWEWYGDITFGDLKNPPFNEKNVKAVLKACSFFVDQIDKEVADTQAFFQN